MLHFLRSPRRASFRAAASDERINDVETVDLDCAAVSNGSSAGKVLVGRVGRIGEVCRIERRREEVRMSLDSILRDDGIASRTRRAYALSNLLVVLQFSWLIDVN